MCYNHDGNGCWPSAVHAPPQSRAAYSSVRAGMPPSKPQLSGSVPAQENSRGRQSELVGYHVQCQQRMGRIARSTQLSSGCKPEPCHWCTL